MRILGIETSCDETGAAIIEGKPGDAKVKLLVNIVASSLTLHAKTGGIIPEIAAREQIKYIIPVIRQAFQGSTRQGSTRGVDARNPAGLAGLIDAIAVTIGPGLIGSLLVGIETAKTLAYVWKKPIIPVNHLIGHIYANFIREIPNSKFQIPNFPAIALVVSGGHTDLVLIKSHQQLTWIGGTRDDAAGEAFDKIGRLLGLSYPAGPLIAKLSEKGNPKAFSFPRPMIDSDDFDFSFSGLKTAVFREIKSKEPEARSQKLITDLSASVQQAIVDVLVKKTVKAAKKYKVKSILLSGGVGANDLLRKKLEVSCQRLEVTFFAPTENLCTDNAAMIAAAAFFNYHASSWKSVTANPNLHF